MRVYLQHPEGRPGDTGESGRFAAIALYLCVCFGAILLYKTSVPGAENVGYDDYGMVVLKALIFAKFMLMGQALRIGDAFSEMPMVYVVAYRSLIFLGVLLVITLVEGVAIALVRGRTIGDAWAVAPGWRELIASAPLLSLILVPYFAIRELGEALGPTTLRKMFVGGEN